MKQKGPNVFGSDIFVVKTIRISLVMKLRKYRITLNMCLFDTLQYILRLLSLIAKFYLLNPVTNGLSHPYHLDESIFFFRGIRSKISFLAHLSQRLIDELIEYSWSGVRPSSVVNNFKHLLLQNRLPDQSQILCGASWSRGNESLFAASGSHDQDGRHAHIW